MGGVGESAGGEWERVQEGSGRECRRGVGVSAGGNGSECSIGNGSSAGGNGSSAGGNGSECRMEWE